MSKLGAWRVVRKVEEELVDERGVGKMYMYHILKKMSKKKCILTM